MSRACSASFSSDGSQKPEAPSRGRQSASANASAQAQVGTRLSAARTRSIIDRLIELCGAAGARAAGRAGVAAGRARRAGRTSRARRARAAPPAPAGARPYRRCAAGHPGRWPPWPWPPWPPAPVGLPVGQLVPSATQRQEGDWAANWSPVPQEGGFVYGLQYGAPEAQSLLVVQVPAGLNQIGADSGGAAYEWLQGTVVQASPLFASAMQSRTFEGLGAQ